ncbi:transcriptional regulator BetI [Afifella sp. IM 167]|uniref:transcriptional regulator BetI n=1 Tax=Afifella sp. IM 167 TaxID=2033586 RepID=UPI001CC94122|nr:transcriptional regulator BetI [Afifella sp. IM 167]MBZ8132750.1 transcriptional regulator BetI [Afifella sp. IM 167]
MPRIGMEPVRRKALIDAAIDAIHQDGMAHVTMGTIARRAGVSAGLAHHYFGGKEKLLLATMRHLLSELGTEIEQRLKQAETPRARISAIIEGNFAPCQFRPAVVSAWLAFYAAAETEPEARRLLRVYRRRLESNLVHALQDLTESRAEAGELAETIAALIDGLWIRHSLAEGEAAPGGATRLVENVVEAALAPRRSGRAKG